MGNNSIRVNSGAKKIEVNDAGDFITLQLGSDHFIRDFYKIMKYIEEETKKKTDKENHDITEETIENVVTISGTVFNMVEDLFGLGTCKKVFGDIENPGIGLFLEFFDSLLPFIEEYQKERDAKFSKYGAGRTGSI